MIKKKFIVSGNYEEYLEYIHKKNRDINNPKSEYIYVNSKRDFDGVLDIEGFYIGTYYKRADIDDIRERINTIKKMYYAKLANDIEINQLAERINDEKEIGYTYNEYSVEPVQQLDNNHVVDYRVNRLFSG
jgi:hypothetical protein